ncbi:MAG: replication-associated recombination protein A [Leptospira sp.]|nr:replication-associated recombination protein A [Leptospira sp.]
MEDLFSKESSSKKQIPLAFSLRPTDWNEFIGHGSVVKSLRSLSKPTSILLYGPPGSGKTTLAYLLTKDWKFEKRYLSCVTSGVKEVREVLEEGKRRGTIVLFLDEIHRFSSSQQDALLQAVEEGEVILISATTENPSFRVNRALLSRLLVFRLHPLSESEEIQIFDSALTRLGTSRTFSREIKQELLQRSSGDARKLLGSLEQILQRTDENEPITIELLSEILGEKILKYDKNSENHYDLISAFIKSLRGSDPDAAMLYLSLMLEAGEDPHFIARRLTVFASEDIGNASVQALSLAIATWQAVERLGMPEGRIPLAQCVCFLASAPKSNASYMAINRANQFVKERLREFEVPNHLRNAPTKTHKAEGAGLDYRYPHDYPGHFLKEKYFPPSLYPRPPLFYFPSEQGFEKNIREHLLRLWGSEKYESERG